MIKAMSATSTKPVTADQLLKMGDIGRCELIYGELVMMSPAGMEHGFIASRICRYLAEFVEANGLGMVFAAETGFKVETHPDLVRAPDVSFVRNDRLPAKLRKGFFSGAPDLAVEVVSPDDSKREVANKVNMWLAHGTVSVWVADPDSMTLAVHRTGEKPVRLAVGARLRNEPALPGFALSLAKIFKRS
jgi:Uma2 family endonuclease